MGPMPTTLAPSSAPSTSEPTFRARHLQEWLANVEHEDDPWRTRFFAAIPADIRIAIESANRLAFLPIAYHVKLADILLEAFGETRAHDYYRRAFAGSLRGPVLGPLFRTGTRLLGVNPATFLRWASKGWDSSIRNCGRLVGEVRSTTSGSLHYHELPPVCTASDAWLDSAQGSAYGVLDTLAIAGIVRLDKSRRSEGGFDLHLEWTERT
jgi:hypothetical protein